MTCGLCCCLFVGWLFRRCFFVVGRLSVVVCCALCLARGVRFAFCCMLTVLVPLSVGCCLQCVACCVLFDVRCVLLVV